MATEVLLAVLVFGTLGAAVVFAALSSARTEERRKSATRKSTLAQDSANTAPKGEKPVDT